MIYKFKSQAAAEVIMLEPQGRQILQIIGKEAGPRGIITLGQIPAAISALQAAVAQEKQARLDADAAADDEDGSPPTDSISLGQRAAPFIDLLQRSAAESHDVVWGV